MRSRVIVCPSYIQYILYKLFGLSVLYVTSNVHAIERI